MQLAENREQYLRELYEFYTNISLKKLMSFEHYKVMTNSKTDKDVYETWLTMKKIQKMLEEKRSK